MLQFAFFNHDFDGDKSFLTKVILRVLMRGHLHIAEFGMCPALGVYYSSSSDPTVAISSQMYVIIICWRTFYFIEFGRCPALGVRFCLEVLSFQPPSPQRHRLNAPAANRRTSSLQGSKSSANSITS